MKDYYKIMGISPDSTLDEIKRARDKLVLEWHPDINKSEEALNKILEINEAFSVLGNEESRKDYDNIIFSKKTETDKKNNIIENYDFFALKFSFIMFIISFPITFFVLYFQVSDFLIDLVWNYLLIGFFLFDFIIKIIAIFFICIIVILPIVMTLYSFIEVISEFFKYIRIDFINFEKK